MIMIADCHTGHGPHVHCLPAALAMHGCAGGILLAGKALQPPPSPQFYSPHRGTRLDSSLNYAFPIAPWNVPLSPAASFLAASAVSSALRFLRDLRDEAVQQKRQLHWKMTNSRWVLKHGRRVQMRVGAWGWGGKDRQV